MRLPLAAVLIAIGIRAVYAASPNAKASNFNTFHAQNQNNTSLRYVANSGICETTPGVDQYSGYIDVGRNMSMVVVLVLSRHSPETAPFTLWLNGGLGCSSMIGLFVENGPCHVNKDGKTTFLNPYSWNNVSNVIYIDQPIGTGFSYGKDTVNSTESAAPFVWKAFQVLFESKVLSKYASRDYGGHYAPSMVSYFDQQNALITGGAIRGERIIVSAVAINDGWIDPKIQFMSCYNFTANAPGYGQLQPDSVLKNISEALYMPGGCVAQEEACYAASSSAESNAICSQASDYCFENVFAPAFGNRNPYDLRENGPPHVPSEYYSDYLKIPDVLKKIGAEVPYQECSSDSSVLFSKTGDDARSWLTELSELANSGPKILLWAGDADIICNWVGNYECALAMEWYGKETFQNTPLYNITLHGTPIAAVANVDNFSFARIFRSGHSVPSYQPAAALEIITQVINKEPLHSV